MHPTQKPLNQMNRLGDMLHFPLLVNAGATLNILGTIAVTWVVAPYHPLLAGLWIAVILFFNLLPVFLLRLTLRPDTSYPPLGRMNFFHDQHKFSDWVYLAASANMAFWVMLAWTAATLHRTSGTLIVLLVVAFVTTLSPALLRRPVKL